MLIGPPVYKAVFSVTRIYKKKFKKFFYKCLFFKDLPGYFQKVLLTTISNVTFLGGGPPTSRPLGCAPIVLAKKVEYDGTPAPAPPSGR